MKQIDPKDKEKFDKENQIDFDKVDKDLFKVVGEKPNQNEKILSKPYGYWRSVGSLLIKNWAFMIALGLLLIFVILMFAGPAGKEVFPANLPPRKPGGASWAHPFGYGMYGEDFWVEIWAGMRTTLLFALLIMAIQLIIGIFIGAIWGYFRKSDLWFINLTNLLNVIPQLIMILFVIFLLKPGYWPVVLGVSIQSWIGMASTVRVQIMLVKGEDYNVASQTLGTKSSKIITRNILPRILPVIVQQGTFAVPVAISIDATLSYLNVGYTENSLGHVLNQVMSTTAWQSHPQLVIIPIILITAISVIFFVLGKTLADSLDPKNHR